MRALAAVLIAAALLVVAGCGEKPEPGAGATPGKLEPFTLVLDYVPNADHAGIYAAQAAGEYRKAGLDVKIKVPPDPAAPLKLLRAGRADAVISYEPELLLARDQGARNLVGVGALVQAPLTSLMAIGSSKVRTPKDLTGKRVATAGIAYQSAYLKTILAHVGVDPRTVKETNVGFKLVPAMISRRADATLGAFWNYEAVDLQQQGRKPRVFRMEQFGVPTYDELIFVARREDLDQTGASKLRRFLQATARGHQLLKRNPEFGVDALLKAEPSLSRRLESAAVRATLPVFFPKDAGKPFGWQDQAEWAAYGRWMIANQLIKATPDPAPPFTNEFLPGQGLKSGA
jgi:putative hydroxymethylpyrimidine transport system substrate-binding protein